MSSCLSETIRQIIALLCLALFACFIAIFVFTLIFYAFDVLWFDEILFNSTSSLFDWIAQNQTEFHLINIDPNYSFDDED